MMIMATIMAMNIIMMITIIQTNIIMNILMIITPMIYIEDIIMITGMQLSASIGTDFCRIQAFSLSNQRNKNFEPTFL